MLHDYSILLTIDVEDWFQVENFKQYIPFSSWSRCESRVEKNTHHLLDLMDCHNGSPTRGQKSGEKLRATFFVLGWIAERLPNLVREIHSRGHEVASHGYYHNLCNEESRQALRTDLNDSRKLLEDIIGGPIRGYRAPSFSIDGDILKIIEDSGYLYDSSFNSFSAHGRYGRADLSHNLTSGISTKISDTFYELPISNISFGRGAFPWGGGAYFRLMPFSLFKMGVESILERQKAYLFYLHPWELDPEQPKVRDASTLFKVRHYANLTRTESKLSSFIKAFKDCRFVNCSQYVQQSFDTHPFCSFPINHVR